MFRWIRNLFVRHYHYQLKRGVFLTDKYGTRFRESDNPHITRGMIASQLEKCGERYPFRNSRHYHSSMDYCLSACDVDMVKPVTIKEGECYVPNDDK